MATIRDRLPQPEISGSDIADIRRDFKLGWVYGRRTGRELSSREIESMYPDADPEVFAQGNIDGVMGDRYRICLAGGER